MFDLKSEPSELSGGLLYVVARQIQHGVFKPTLLKIVK